MSVDEPEVIEEMYHTSKGGARESEDKSTLHFDVGGKVLMKVKKLMNERLGCDCERVLKERNGSAKRKYVYR